MDCEGCKLIDNPPDGGVVELHGGWSVNQYGGSEGYLGWMALQPKSHRMNISELTNGELENMGKNIAHIDQVLSDYWRLKFPNDPLERIYVTYFFDSVFNAMPSPYHLHMHMIPRTQRIKELILDNGNIICWDIYKAAKNVRFPREYIKTPENITELMDFIREST